MVAWPSASKSVQSMATLMLHRDPDHVGDPVAQCGVDIDPLVGQQPVHLLDRMLGHQAARQGEALADRIDRQRSGLDDADGLPRSKGFGSVSSSAPRIMVARAEIRNLPARGNQYMTCADCEATPACIDSFSTEFSTESPRGDHAIPQLPFQRL